MENDKLVRLIDVIETVENQCSDGNMWGNENLTPIDARKTIDELSDIPAVDAVEVVRCRECYAYETVDYYGGGQKRICRLLDRQIQEDDYCSYGQRREDGDA